MFPFVWGKREREKREHEEGRREELVGPRRTSLFIDKPAAEEENKGQVHTQPCGLGKPSRVVDLCLFWAWLSASMFQSYSCRTQCGIWFAFAGCFKPRLICVFLNNLPFG